MPELNTLNVSEVRFHVAVFILFLQLFGLKLKVFNISAAQLELLERFLFFVKRGDS
jgi:hypothetical protein